MTAKESEQLDNIIEKLEAIRKKESVYNETIITERLLSKDDVQLLITKATYIFK